MKVLVSWLRELVDVSANAPELGQRLHLAGFELAGVESRADADAVIDSEITANRPDCLSMVGIAREVSTLCDTPLKYKAATFASAGDAAAADTLRVTIEDAELCPRYTAALADVTVGPSPAWLVTRLAAAGVRSISNIVDITNYVLLETGQPLHAFDLAKLAGPELRIRRARPEERVRTLDGQTRTLAPEMLVIADAERAQAVAGVMGGAESEVSSTTKTIVLESAYFHAPSVRRTSKRLGLSTEASYRFERGADREAASTALARACQLIEQGAGRARPEWIDAQSAAGEPRSITLRRARVGRVLGFDVPAGEIHRILRSLGFGLEAPNPSSLDETTTDAELNALFATFEREPPSDSPVSPVPVALSTEEPAVWRVTVPSWRVDVTREIDLVEEVARIAGYERIPTTFPPLQVAPPSPNLRLARDARLRDIARALGFSESVTFSFIEREAALRYADADDLVSIVNPLAETFSAMRPALLPGLVASVGHNRRREQRDVRLFELANRFTRRRGEHRALALAWTGEASPTHWSGTARQADIFDMSGALSALCHVLGLDAVFVPAPVAYLSEVTASHIEVRSRGETTSARRTIGILGQLDPALADVAGLSAREPLFVAEIDLDAVLDWTDLGERVRAVALARFPSSVRDLSIVVPLGLPAADIRGTIREAAPPTLESVWEFDRYQGPHIPQDKWCVSLRLTFRAVDRTLTDADVQTAFDAVVAALAARHGASLR